MELIVYRWVYYLYCRDYGFYYCVSRLIHPKGAQLPLFLSPKSINTLWYSDYEPILIMVLLLCGPVTMVYSGFVGRRLFLCIAGVSLLLSFAFLGWIFRSSLLVLFSPKDYFDKLHPFFLLFHNENLNRKVLYWFCFTVVKWSLAISSFLIGLKILLIWQQSNNESLPHYHNPHRCRFIHARNASCRRGVPRKTEPLLKLGR